MKRKLLNTKDYTKFGRNCQLKIEGFYEKTVLGDDKVRLLEEVSEGLDFTKLYRAYFMDGTKIEANANKYSFVWKKTEFEKQYPMVLLSFGKATLHLL